MKDICCTKMSEFLESLLTWQKVSLCVPESENGAEFLFFGTDTTVPNLVFNLLSLRL